MQCRRLSLYARSAHLTGRLLHFCTYIRERVWKDWQEKKTIDLQQALTNLDDRSRDILQRRWLSEDKTTLQELANTYKVSAERIRQLENNAIKKLKGVMEG